VEALKPRPEGQGLLCCQALGVILLGVVLSIPMINGVIDPKALRTYAHHSYIYILMMLKSRLIRRGFIYNNLYI